MKTKKTVLRSSKGKFKSIPKTMYEFNLDHYKETSKSKVIAELTHDQMYIRELLKEGQQLKDDNIKLNRERIELKGIIKYLDK